MLLGSVSFHSSVLAFQYCLRKNSGVYATHISSSSERLVCVDDVWGLPGYSVHIGALFSRSPGSLSMVLTETACLPLT